MTENIPLVDLENRAALPEALRVLLDEYPRTGWEAHPNFTGLVQFWLEKHLMFRKLLEMLQNDSKEMLDRDMDAQQYAARLSRFGGMMLSQMHGHHQIEDHHYFPKLRQLDSRLERGFDILDKDHLALDGILNRFAETANGVLSSVADSAVLHEATGKFDRELVGFEKFLNRHLEDEEELIVPVILKNGVSGLE
ncbi:MAG: hemerythrin domain-containing protein [Paracoccaceae bacterium]